MPTDIWFETKGDMAWAILDRPKALNSLDLAMIDRLTEWLVASGVGNKGFALGIRAAGRAAFPAVECARAAGSSFWGGGEGRVVFAARTTGAPLHRFYWREYRLNRAIRRC